MPAPDTASLGLVLAILGAFLLGNAILFLPPHAFIQDLFQIPRGRLASIRHYIFHRVQLSIGFFYLVLGFMLQLLARYQPAPSPSFPSLYAGALLLLTL